MTTSKQSKVEPLTGEEIADSLSVIPDGQVSVTLSVNNYRRLLDIAEDHARLSVVVAEALLDAERWLAAYKLMEHKVITCGVAASHPDASLSHRLAYAEKWESPQAESVRELRAERDTLRAQLDEAQGAARRNAESLTAALDDANAKLNEALGIGETLAAQLDEANHEVDRRGVVIGELQVKLAHAQLGCCDCNSSVARECAEKLDAARREVESLLTQQDVMRAKLDAANARIERLEKALRDLYDHSQGYGLAGSLLVEARRLALAALTASRDEGE